MIVFGERRRVVGVGLRQIGRGGIVELRHQRLEPVERFLRDTAPPPAPVEAPPSPWVTAALREIRVALLEADVALPVVKDFIDVVRVRAVGEEVIRSVTPGQMVVKIVHDHLAEMLGSSSSEINLAATPPVAILMVGLQGSGKTTTTAKLGTTFTATQQAISLSDTQTPGITVGIRRLGFTVVASQPPATTADGPGADG